MNPPETGFCNLCEDLDNSLMSLRISDPSAEVERNLYTQARQINHISLHYILRQYVVRVFGKGMSSLLFSTEPSLHFLSSCSWIYYCQHHVQCPYDLHGEHRRHLSPWLSDPSQCSRLPHHVRNRLYSYSCVAHSDSAGPSFCHTTGVLRKDASDPVVPRVVALGVVRPRLLLCFPHCLSEGSGVRAYPLQIGLLHSNGPDRDVCHHLFTMHFLWFRVLQRLYMLQKGDSAEL